jgi:hypothetical protein
MSSAGTQPGDPGGGRDLSGSRVEVTIGEGSKEGSDYVVTMRDGSDPDGPVLVFTPAEWEAFVAGVQDGEFDLDESGALVDLGAEARPDGPDGPDERAGR